jgi:hypothetical protein
MRSQVLSFWKQLLNQCRVLVNISLKKEYVGVGAAPIANVAGFLSYLLLVALLLKFKMDTQRHILIC